MSPEQFTELRGVRAGLVRNDVELGSASDGLLAKASCGLCPCGVTGTGCLTFDVLLVAKTTCKVPRA